MSQTLQLILDLARQGKLRISNHAYDEMVDDGLLAAEVVAGLEQAIVVEDYPGYGKGPCVLVLQHDSAGLPIHALWGIPAGKTEPAVLITVYRPDPARWDQTFQRRL